MMGNNPFALGYKAGPEHRTQLLARAILDLEASPECRGMPYRATTYAEILGVSTRTVGRSLAVLRKAGAVRLLSRGPFPPALEVADLDRLCAVSVGEAVEIEDGGAQAEPEGEAQAEPKGEAAPTVEALAAVVGSLVEAVRTLADDVLMLRLRLEDSGPLSRQFRRQRRRRGQRRWGARMPSKAARGSA